MGLKDEPHKVRLERGLGLGGCLVGAIPFLLLGKGLVLWLWIGWVLPGLVLIGFSIAAVVGVIRAFSQWNVHFIDIFPLQRTLSLGQRIDGKDVVEDRFSFDDFEGVGCLKVGEQGACYALVAKLKPEKALTGELAKYVDTQGYLHLTWWTQEYAGTINKMVHRIVANGVKVLNF